MDLAAYRAEAEKFLSALDREYYLHFSGQRERYEIEPIYESHAGLFSRAAVEDLRESGARPLLEFAVKGLIGRATKAEEAELARLEATLEVAVDGERLGYRESSVVQANEGDPDRRAAIETARHAVLDERLNPLLRELTERSHALAVELGWTNLRAMCEELSGIDLGSLHEQTDSFLRSTDDRYRALVEPRLREQLGFGFRRLRRSDLSAFFRAPALDRHFPAEHLLASLAATLAGMGMELGAQPGVRLDMEARPKKSPRAFCAPVRVPDEVYLVIAPVGGREDYAALFHEAGHTEHYAHTDRRLPVEDRYLGDNSITEGFAFLLEHLISEPGWLRRRLQIEDAAAVVQHADAVKLVFLRRYCAKLAYELALHGPGGSPELYARLLSEAVGVEWPAATWLSDVDPFFYVARYLRAWALEARLRSKLVERFGEAWFGEPAAGEHLRSLWRQGQGSSPEELLGAELDFSLLAP